MPPKCSPFPATKLGRWRRLESAVVGTGKTYGDLPSRSAERVEDAERDHVVTLLREHCTAGGLTLHDFSERAGAALAARTRGGLEATLADLLNSTFWEYLGTYRG